MSFQLISHSFLFPVWCITTGLTCATVKHLAFKAAVFVNKWLWHCSVRAVVKVHVPDTCAQCNLSVWHVFNHSALSHVPHHTHVHTFARCSSESSSGYSIAWTAAMTQQPLDSGDWMVFYACPLHVSTPDTTLWTWVQGLTFSHLKPHSVCSFVSCVSLVLGSQDHQATLRTTAVFSVTSRMILPLILL